MRVTERSKGPEDYLHDVIKERLLGQLKYVLSCYPPAREASREVGKLIEGKIHTPKYMVSKNLSVCLSQTLTRIISGLGKQNWL